MLFHPGHGTTVFPDDATSDADSEALRTSHLCGYEDPEKGQAVTRFGQFGYLFPKTQIFPQSATTTADLDALADAMVQPAPLETQDSQIAPVFTYFGQFIDHDITANTDRDTDISAIDADVVTPTDRDAVIHCLQNLRAATLNLDSVHGGGPDQGPIARKFDEALRFPGNRAMLWVGKDAPSPFDPIALPADPARDLLRVDRFLQDDNQVLTEEDFRALPRPMRDMFVNSDGTIRRQKAIIGDMRNDENLVVAQFHLAMVRLHNRIVATAHDHPDAPRDDPDALFDWARRMTSWHYQWLIVNTYLPAICDQVTLAQILARGPAVYNRFLAAHGPTDGNLLPMPLEFSAAAFRFGHTMVRDAYDWSFQFGRPKNSGLADRANFQLLFLFTGNGKHPMAAPTGPGTFGPSAPRLPQHWPIDWSRFVHPPTPEMPDRSARKIDTRIAVNLGQMHNENPGKSGRMAQLASRNLRRGYKLNLPSAQACIAELQINDKIALPQLTPAQLTSGPTGKAVTDGKFQTETPLWFYVLKEAEELGQGGRLGPLGSLIVADTLLGLIVNDPDSYWHASKTPGTWHPRDGVQPDGVEIDSMAAMMRAARLL